MQTCSQATSRGLVEEAAIEFSGIVCTEMPTALTEDKPSFQPGTLYTKLRK